MHDRRGGRPSHVRPRSPSTGRPAPAKVRPRAQVPGRVSPHRRVEQGRGLPLLSRLLLVVAVGALGLAVFFTATGGLARVVGAIGGTVDGVIDDLTATPTPEPSVPVVADAPTIVAPDEPYTRQPSIDLELTLPEAVLGDAATRVRLYVALEGQDAAPVKEAPIGDSTRLILPAVELTAGRNDFTATLLGPAGESEPSPVATWFLDQLVPQIYLTSPEDGATINRAAVTLTGRSQGRSTLVARNAENAASVTATASADGSFELSLPIAAGSNTISMTSTDPAGNVGELVLKVIRGEGKLTAELTANSYRFELESLPRPLELSLVVTDPDGRPLEGAQVTFLVSPNGIPTITDETETGGDGGAAFRTTIPEGADPGDFLVLADVRTEEFGRTAAQTTVTIEE